MKRWMTSIVGLLAFMAPSAALAQSITYQGQLTDASGPVNGPVNLQIRMFDAAAAGNQVGNTLNFNALNISDGLFTIPLNFGFNNTLAFSSGTARWLEITVNGTTLAPRQELTPAPYALRAMKPWEPSGFNPNDIFFTGNGVFGTGKVGIADTTPVATLTVGDGDKFQVSGTDGDVRFADPAGGIIFPDTGLNSGPMIQMFDLGNTLPTSRMVIAHSFNFPMEGLQYSNHAYTFRSASNFALHIDPEDEFVGVNRTTRVTSAEYFGVQAPVGGTSYGGMYIRTNGATAKPFYGYSTGPQDAWTYLDGTTGDWRVHVGGDRLTVTESGNVGIGTTTPGVRLHIDGGTDSEPASGGFVVVGPTSGANITIDNNEIMARSNGAPATLFLNNDGGAVRVPVLEITGADVAEKFPSSDPRESIKPGMVMEIDPDNAGKLRISHSAYNRRVAGVVSGAGDIPVGAILGNLPGHDDAPPIALSGRVWVQCDASHHAIASGDLLTTANLSGYAMKVTDYPRAQGAIIGKAMSNLAAGDKGLVLVLVNLQ